MEVSNCFVFDAIIGSPIQKVAEIEKLFTKLPRGKDMDEHGVKDMVSDVLNTIFKPRTRTWMLYGTSTTIGHTGLRIFILV